MRKEKRSRQASLDRRSSVAQLIRHGGSVSQLALRVGCTEEEVVDWIRRVSDCNLSGRDSIAAVEREELELLWRRRTMRLMAAREVLLKSCESIAKTTGKAVTIGNDPDSRRVATDSCPEDDISVWVRGLS